MICGFLCRPSGFYLFQTNLYVLLFFIISEIVSFLFYFCQHKKDKSQAGFYVTKVTFCFQSPWTSNCASSFHTSKRHAVKICRVIKKGQAIFFLSNQQELCVGNNVQVQKSCGGVMDLLPFVDRPKSHQATNVYIKGLFHFRIQSNKYSALSKYKTTQNISGRA